MEGGASAASGADSEGLASGLDNHRTGKDITTAGPAAPPNRPWFAEEGLLRPIVKVLEAQGASLLHHADETGTDVIPLSVAGVPTFAPIQDARTYFDYHHTAADTLDKIRPQELRENVALAAVLAYGLANMNGRLRGVPKPMPDWLK